MTATRDDAVATLPDRLDSILGTLRAEYGRRHRHPWIVAPDRMNQLVFPGDARVAGTFAGRSGKRVELGASVRGAFGFASGIPAFSLENHASGLFLIVADDGKHPAVGAGFLAGNGIYAAAWGSKDSFFGLGERYGYSGTRGVDAEAGHRNLYARFSRQWSSAAPLVRAIRGDAVGVTAEYAFNVSPETAITLSAHMDRFVGGRADTVFGSVTVRGSRWNRSTAASIDHRPSGRESLSLTADRHWLGRGNDAAGVSARYRLAF